jgi:hypothetical protein
MSSELLVIREIDAEGFEKRHGLVGIVDQLLNLSTDSIQVIFKVDVLAIRSHCNRSIFTRSGLHNEPQERIVSSKKLDASQVVLEAEMPLEARLLLPPPWSSLSITTTRAPSRKFTLASNAAMSPATPDPTTKTARDMLLYLGSQHPFSFIPSCSVQTDYFYYLTVSPVRYFYYVRFKRCPLAREAAQHSPLMSDSGSADEGGGTSEDQDESEVESEVESGDESDPAEIETGPKASTLKATVDALFHLSERMDASRGRLQARFPISNTPACPPPDPSPPLAPATPELTLLDPYIHSSRAEAPPAGGCWEEAPQVAAALRILLGQDGPADHEIVREEHARLARFGSSSASW